MTAGENKVMSVFVDHLLKQQDAMIAMLRDMVEMKCSIAII